ncbi:MAG TPA: hypothetical protein VJ890_15110, partial [Vineibacter sp.]|nr:hypothetical protein [Vineibacter sp.]
MLSGGAGRVFLRPQFQWLTGGHFRPGSGHRYPLPLSTPAPNRLLLEDDSRLLSESGHVLLLEDQTPTLDQALVVSGFASSNAFGAASLHLTILPASIDDTTDGFGAASVNPTLAPASIDDSADGFGAAALHLTILPAGVGDADAFGVPTFTLYLQPSAIADGDGFGAPSVNATLSPASVD